MNQLPKKRQANNLTPIQPGEKQKRALRISHNLMIINDLQLKDAITAHANYVDPEGNAATSPSGFMKSINARIAKVYGVKREDMDDFTAQHCGVLLELLCKTIRKMEHEKALRPEIKTKVKQLIEMSGKQYHALIDGANQ